MARLGRPKTSSSQVKTLRIPLDIRYLLVGNLVLNLAILYFITR